MLRRLISFVSAVSVSVVLRVRLSCRFVLWLLFACIMLIVHYHISQLRVCQDGWLAWCFARNLIWFKYFFIYFCWFVDLFFFRTDLRSCDLATRPPAMAFSCPAENFYWNRIFFFLFLFPVLFSLPGYLIVLCLCYFCVRFGSIFLSFFPKSVQMIYDFYWVVCFRLIDLASTKNVLQKHIWNSNRNHVEFSGRGTGF